MDIPCQLGYPSDDTPLLRPLQTPRRSRYPYLTEIHDYVVSLPVLFRKLRVPWPIHDNTSHASSNSGLNLLDIVAEEENPLRKLAQRLGDMFVTLFCSFGASIGGVEPLGHEISLVDGRYFRVGAALVGVLGGGVSDVRKQEFLGKDAARGIYVNVDLAIVPALDGEEDV